MLPSEQVPKDSNVLTVPQLLLQDTISGTMQ